MISRPQVRGGGGNGPYNGARVLYEYEYSTVPYLCEFSHEYNSTVRVLVLVLYSFRTKLVPYCSVEAERGESARVGVCNSLSSAGGL